MRAKCEICGGFFGLAEDVAFECFEGQRQPWFYEGVWMLCPAFRRATVQLLLGVSCLAYWDVSSFLSLMKMVQYEYTVGFQCWESWWGLVVITRGGYPSRLGRASRIQGMPRSGVVDMQTALCAEPVGVPQPLPLLGYPRQFIDSDCKLLCADWVRGVTL